MVPDTTIEELASLLMGGIGAAKAVGTFIVDSTRLALIDALESAPLVAKVLKTDGAHSATGFFRREALESGTVAPLVGSDGVRRLEVTLRVEGGTMEYIYQRAKQGWELTHGFFNCRNSDLI